MYEHLDNLRPDLSGILESLSPLEPEKIEMIRSQHPGCPNEYFQFLIERGAGVLEENGEPFFFESQLLSAEHEYFKDKKIYEYGAKGDIFIFGWESMGTAYGFDSGDCWNLKEVDEYRIVTPLELTFKQFIEGLLVCYPQIPMKYVDGVWTDGVGRKYVKQI